MQTVTAPVTTTAAPARPHLVAKIAIVVARANNPKIIDQMDRCLEAVEITGETPDDLRLKCAEYASDAIKRIGDPGNGAAAVAVDAAVLAGVRLSDAARGVMPNRDA